jgi:hypothetical protein
VCTNAASRARDGDPRFAPVALAGYTAAYTPDSPVSLLRAPRLANLSPFCGLHPAARCLRDEVIVRGADTGPRTLGHHRSAELIHGFLELHRHRCRALKRPSAPGRV